MKSTVFNPTSVLSARTPSRVGPPVRALAALSGLLASAGAAHAYLGSCSPNDGYSLSMFVGSANWADVTYYNAGDFGPNAGGGSPNFIAPDSGKWTLLTSKGAFFPNAAARNAAVGASPPYPTSVPPGTIPAYMVGNHFPGRNFDGSNLAFRNDTPLGSGAIRYAYALDSYDFGGFTPTSVTSGTVTMQLYFCPNPGDTPPSDGTPSPDKFTMTLKDQSGNIGLEWGYTRTNEVTWRTSPSNNWTTTGIIADQTDWDGVRFDIDLSNDTFSFDYYVVATNTWQNVVPAGTALGMAMQNLTTLEWQLEDGLFAGVGGKNYFDDFSFIVPSPSAAVLLGLGTLTLSARRRRHA
ncbi:MAG: hypothetical protein KF768_12835 [Phycisphaeraceae bacterium]|nr:hypothetical protein [Phycisphaeraceae bacterium]